jgi:hypothetical protein
VGGGGTGGADPITLCEEAGTNVGACYNTSAFATSGVPPSFGCDSFSNPSQISACHSLVSCLRSAACNAQILAAHDNGSSDYPFLDDGTPCLCGATVSKSSCFATTTWSGVCQAQYAAAADGAGGVAVGFFDTTVPIGVANNLFTCDVDAMCIPAGGI